MSLKQTLVSDLGVLDDMSLGKLLTSDRLALDDISLKQLLVSDRGVLDQLGGITGFGWTISILSYVGTVLGYGNSLVMRLVADPQSLLYLGGVLFGATFGLDRLRDTLSDRDRDPER